MKPQQSRERGWGDKWARRAYLQTEFSGEKRFSSFLGAPLKKALRSQGVRLGGHPKYPPHWDPTHPGLLGELPGRKKPGLLWPVGDSAPCTWPSAQMCKAHRAGCHRGEEDRPPPTTCKGLLGKGTLQAYRPEKPQMVSAGGLRESRPEAARGAGNTCQERQGLIPVCFLFSWQFLISFDLSSLWEPHTCTHTLTHFWPFSVCTASGKGSDNIKRRKKYKKSSWSLWSRIPAPQRNGRHRNRLGELFEEEQQGLSASWAWEQSRGSVRYT